MLTSFKRRMASAFGFESATMTTVGVTFGACCSNVVYLEHLVKLDPGCTSLITFSQFAFIALEKFFSETRCFTRPRAVPLSRYLQMVGVFFAGSVLNNYALSFDIPMPLHMIFKSASLLSNMILGIFILKRSYSLRKYCAVSLITLGILQCTMAGKPQVAGISTMTFSITQLMGIGILIVALFLSSLMGILQERMTQDFGKHPGEMMFYIHALALPAFILFWPQMSSSFQFLLSTEASLGIIPTGILYLLINVVTQYVCIGSVFKLSTECTSLTVTLVITLRKFISLIISIFYFNNQFTNTHWMGTAFVFLGTFLFLDMNQKKRNVDEEVGCEEVKKEQ